MKIEPATREDRDLYRMDRRTGFLFGLLAGSTLLIVAWGIDAWQLFHAGGILPLAKAFFAAACLLLPLGMLGWLSIRLRSLALSALLWLFAGVVFGWFAAQVAFRLFPWALARWAPEAARFIAYYYGIGPSTRAVVCAVLCGAVFLFAGLTIDALVEACTRAEYPATRLFSILAWVTFFAVSGALVDAFIQRPLRIPTTTIDDLIAYRQTVPRAMETEKARLLHASVLNPIVDLLPRRYRLVVASYDETLSVFRVVVDFEGTWVQCTLIENQPSYCDRLE
jgi:hypothetical protein